jgi:hypothetical protein
MVALIVKVVIEHVDGRIAERHHFEEGGASEAGDKGEKLCLVIVVTRVSCCVRRVLTSAACFLWSIRKSALDVNNHGTKQRVYLSNDEEGGDLYPRRTRGFGILALICR